MYLQAFPPSHLPSTNHSTQAWEECPSPRSDKWTIGLTCLRGISIDFHSRISRWRASSHSLNRLKINNTNLAASFNRTYLQFGTFVFEQRFALLILHLFKFSAKWTIWVTVMLMMSLSIIDFSPNGWITVCSQLFKLLHVFRLKTLLLLRVSFLLLFLELKIKT